MEILRTATEASMIWRHSTKLLVVALLACALGLEAAPSAANTLEYKIKAVFLLNFTQFVQWPPKAFPDAGAPVVIGILGEDPFDDFIDQVVKGEKVDDRTVQVRRFSDVAQVDACNVLFISRSESGDIRQILAKLKGRAILTVSDSDNFTRFGGMIRFYEDENRVRLRINNEEALSEGLKISSKLLRPSQIVTSAGN